MFTATTLLIVTGHRFFFVLYRHCVYWGTVFLCLLKVSDAVEERMASKAKAQKAREADSFLRKGRLSPEQEEEVW